MKTLALYYSRGGHTKKYAEALGAEAVLELVPTRRVGILKALALGCIAAARGRAWRIEPLDVNLSDFERIVLLAPVWAGGAAPPLNAALELLPPGKTVDVRLVSAGGKSACRERIKAKITERGCALGSFEDIKA
ncbi:MAG: flavodoxin domain-containing protein [Oscillospiraceae bacterium]|jgi:hypothetical protein|nr:flavodoxin domain-containing protein [Oscillospiraceae bacterium]